MNNNRLVNAEPYKQVNAVDVILKLLLERPELETFV